MKPISHYFSVIRIAVSIEKILKRQNFSISKSNSEHYRILKDLSIKQITKLEIKKLHSFIKTREQLEKFNSDENWFTQYFNLSN